MLNLSLIAVVIAGRRINLLCLVNMPVCNSDILFISLAVVILMLGIFAFWLGRKFPIVTAPAGENKQCEIPEVQRLEHQLETARQRLKYVADNWPCGKYKKNQFQPNIADQKLSLLFQQSALAAIECNTDLEITSWNPAAERIFGYSAAEAIGQDLNTLIPLANYNNSSEEMGGEMLQQAGSTHSISENLTKDGNIIACEWHNTPLVDEGGNALGMVCLVNDITERRRFRDKLLQSEAKFRELASREALLNRMASQIRASLDFNTVVETAVREIYHLLKLERCAFRLYLPEAIPAMTEVIAEVRDCEFSSVMGNRVPASDIVPLISKICRKEVTKIEDTLTLEEPVERKFFLETLGYRAVVFVPVHTQSGKMGAISCSYSSQTHNWTDSEVELLEKVADKLAIALTQAELYERAKKSAETAQTKAGELEAALWELKQTQAQLVQQEKMSSLGQLVAGIAHEINNPISFIYGNITYAKEYAADLLELLQVYQEYCPYPPEAIETKAKEIDLEFIQEDCPKILNSMKSGAERIRQIVLSLRNFSRLDEADMKPVSLHEGLDSTLLILEHRLKAHPNRPAIQVIKEYGNLPDVECYASQMNQVFLNLLSNAIDALDQGFFEGGWLYEKPAIWIGTEVLDGERVAISIADNGGGIPESIKSRVFEPFFTTKPVGKGTGLGLSISYQIVEKHGGTLECVSSGGSKTEFVVKIPIGYNYITG
ncbi:MAG: PAS domain S-box protein [Oscillatoria sp. Prado101]|jgi:PAS domain S-box-containing protein|nr:PAS domain S-box protein [Oscillatoria sp. Prado101]